ncbi:hypothetical protein PUMCH_000697 [Australozyma saopauloensis]|uniref:Uncharacterized protein n=1 Tax=Australozyma saopauloensis TaxID=291208 RepID=A0AAX4H4G7_9ASCO|nr:hypothetical protein PUMCH_000697 [[Candida] saopauloensis]
MVVWSPKTNLLNARDSYTNAKSKLTNNIHKPLSTSCKILISPNSSSSMSIGISERIALGWPGRVTSCRHNPRVCRGSQHNTQRMLDTGHCSPKTCSNTYMTPGWPTPLRILYHVLSSLRSLCILSLFFFSLLEKHLSTKLLGSSESLHQNIYL